MTTPSTAAAGELAEPYQLGVGEVERLRGDLLQAANLELKGNPYIAHRKKQINALCDAAKAAAMRTPAPSAQEEWRTVPVEPTEEIIDAAGGKYVDLYRADDPGYAPAEVYAAMLAAAPSAPAVAVDFEQLWESVLDIQKEERPNNRDMLANTQGGDLEFFKYMAEQCVNLTLRTATPQAGREDSQSVKAWAIVGPDGWIYTESMSDLNARDAWWNFKQSNRQKTGSVESLKQDGYRAEQVTISTARGQRRKWRG